MNNLKLPVLVLHGNIDKMVNVSGGIATAEAIPNARLVLFEHLGHSIPNALWAEFADLISEQIEQAEKQ